MYKHSNAVVHINQFDSNLQSNHGNEHIALNDMPHVYHMINENEIDELNDADARPEMLEIHYEEPSSLRASEQITIQNEYMRPYSSLLDNTEPENHSYEKPLMHYIGSTNYNCNQMDDITRPSSNRPVNVSNVGYMEFPEDQNNHTNKNEWEIRKSINTSTNTITHTMNTTDDNISLD